MIKVFFDGACTPNPGGIVSYGAVIFKDEKVFYEISKTIDIPEEQRTNNSAEYIACLSAMNFLLYHKLEGEGIVFYGDSQLVINQLSGKWQINDGAYTTFAIRALFNSKLFKDIKFIWIKREENNYADRLAQMAQRQEVE